MAEIHIHGGKASVLAIQNEISKVENCRLAEPGEFTKLAFQNGKINLLKAESIADLISAETEIQRLQAVKIMKGKSSEKFNQLREKLLKILSFVEAKIDFPEEDLPEENLKKIKKDSLDILNEINKILNDQKIGEIIREGFKIAILGPTNAGKSSLLNNLSNREVAIVSEIAGTTRDVIETHLNINLDEFIAENEDDYINKAVNFSKNPNTLENLNKDLRKKVLSSPLFDIETFSDDLQSIFLDLIR